MGVSEIGVYILKIRFAYYNRHIICRYDGNHVTLKHISGGLNQEVIPKGIDMTNYSQSFEWDVMDVVSNVNNKFDNNSLEEFRPYIKFSMTLRRKTLFYTVNLIIPCISMSFLTVIVFGLPSESG